jgi:hypothetical protein
MPATRARVGRGQRCRRACLRLRGGTAGRQPSCPVQTGGVGGRGGGAAFLLLRARPCKCKTHHSGHTQAETQASAGSAWRRKNGCGTEVVAGWRPCAWPQFAAHTVHCVGITKPQVPGSPFAQPRISLAASPSMRESGACELGLGQAHPPHIPSAPPPPSAPFASLLASPRGRQ